MNGRERKKYYSSFSSSSLTSMLSALDIGHSLSKKLQEGAQYKRGEELYENVFLFGKNFNEKHFLRHVEVEAERVRLEFSEPSAMYQWFAFVRSNEYEEWKESQKKKKKNSLESLHHSLPLHSPLRPDELEKLEQLRELVLGVENNMYCGGGLTVFLSRKKLFHFALHSSSPLRQLNSSRAMLPPPN